MDMTLASSSSRTQTKNGMDIGVLRNTLVAYAIGLGLIGIIVYALFYSGH